MESSDGWFRTYAFIHPGLPKAELHVHPKGRLSPNSRWRLPAQRVALRFGSAEELREAYPHRTAILSRPLL